MFLYQVDNFAINICLMLDVVINKIGRHDMRYFMYPWTEKDGRDIPKDNKNKKCKHVKIDRH